MSLVFTFGPKPQLKFKLNNNCLMLHNDLNLISDCLEIILASFNMYLISFPKNIEMILISNRNEGIWCEISRNFEIFPENLSHIN